LKYDNAFATSKTGLGVKSEGQLIVSGTKGYCVVDAPWWKTKSFELRFEDSESNEKSYFKFAGDGLRYELSDFVATVNGQIKNNYRFTREDSIAMAVLMEKFLKQR
jgi:choline-phosphate cytidylyltransferase